MLGGNMHLIQNQVKEQLSCGLIIVRVKKYLLTKLDDNLLVLNTYEICTSNTFQCQVTCICWCCRWKKNYGQTRNR